MAEDWGKNQLLKYIEYSNIPERSLYHGKNG